jgi:ribosomal protein L37AE/L43A
MDTTTLVVIGGAVAVLVVVGGYYLLVRWRREQRVEAETFLHFRCPGCQRRLRFQARQAGHKGKCSHCGHDVVFPPAGQSID